MTPQEITRAREDLGLTQRALAEHLGVAANTLSRWEVGAIEAPPYLPIVFEAMLVHRIIADVTRLLHGGFQTGGSQAVVSNRSVPLSENGPMGNP